MPGTRTEPTLLWVCICCMLAHCNGDASGCEHYCAPEHHTELLDEIPEDADVTAGLLAEEHDDQCANHNVAEVMDHECECDRIEFSKRPCEGCGSPLAGERHALTMWTEPAMSPA